MHKTIQFRTVEWFGHPENIVELLRAALLPRPTIPDTDIIIGVEHVEVRHRDTPENAIRLHLNTYIEGARKGAAPHADVAANGDLIECTAPANSEFSEREIAVVVRSDQVGFIAVGHVRDKFVEKAIRGLLVLQHGVDLAVRFSLSARANAAKLEQLMQEGVNYLDLGLSLPHVDAVAQEEGQPETIARHLGRSVKDALSARFMADHADEDVDELSKATARLIMRFRKSAPLGQIDSLTALARDAIEEDDEFKLKTRNGNKYSRDQLLVSGNYNQPGPAHVLSYVQAWNAITQFMDEQI